MFGELTITLETLGQIVGILLSLIFSYFPGAKEWFEKLDSKNKPLFMLAVNFVVLAVIFGFSCLGWLSAVACTVDGAVVLLRIFVQAMLANQATYLLTRKLT